MITEIHIKNYTIIDEVRLELSEGMHVLTGETGAGKSIIVDAVALALGARLSGNPVRQDCDRADISMVLDVSEIPEATFILNKYALGEDDHCFIRRIIYKDGKSKSYVNDIPTTSQVLRELSEALVDIHGQHEFQQLLKHASQLALLDRFAEQTDLVQQLNELFDQWLEVKQAVEALKDSMSKADARMELLTYQLQELDELDLGEKELDEVTREHKQLSNIDTLLQQCQKAMELLSEAPAGSIKDQLVAVYAAIDSVKTMNKKLLSASELVTNAVTYVNEAIVELRSFLDHADTNPERLSYLDERLSKIHQVARKHRVKPESLFSYYQQLKTELDQVKKSDERLDQLMNDRQKLEADYFIQAEKLSAGRLKAAKQLSKRVTAGMQTLGMEGGRFDIVLTGISDRKPSRQGLEKIEFLVSTNPGQPLLPLSQIASGGELSRLSLIIQVMTAEKNTMPTIIFDEVDVGIGGATAEIVGQLLRELGGSTQVLCITHLAQVAAKGHHHFKIEKQSNKKETRVEVLRLDHSDRVQEIARMSGGIKITPQTLAHAEEMLLGSHYTARDFPFFSTEK